MAEGLFRHAMGDRNEYSVSSAGLSAMEGLAPSRNAVEALSKVGIDISGLRSRLLTREIVATADRLYVMSRDHLEAIAQIFPGAMSKTRLLREFGRKERDGETEVMDPIGTSMEVYEQCRDEILEGITGIIRNMDGDETPVRRIAVGSDHAGYELKAALLEHLESKEGEVVDCGTSSTESVDYPDFAGKVVRELTGESCRTGILICSTGIGMSMAANRTTGIRAALVHDVETARLSRSHNNANILCLPARSLTGEDACRIVDTFLSTGFDGGRHARRLGRLSGRESLGLSRVDPDIDAAIRRETVRQRDHLELIASENFTSPAVLEAQGSVLTNKYAEGYPRRRWYGGCEVVDDVEDLARERALRIFGAEHANVQPHSGSGANMAVYFAILEPGDRILTMDLSHGGHLTHGNKVNFSGRFFDVVHYGVRKEDERIDYEEIERLAREHSPAMITVGASAYPRIIDFERLGGIAREVRALLLADIAHIAGLVATGLHPSPVPHADFVTSTTHKTLRGPRGGLVLCREEHARKIDSQVFPGIQGGPLMHAIAAKAVCFREALQPDFREYQQRTLDNAVALAARLQHHDLRLVSGGTDNHLVLIDVGARGLSGRICEKALDRAGITVNKNTIPFETRSPFQASGIRLGTPALTTRGMNGKDMERIGDWIAEILRDPEDLDTIRSVRQGVEVLTANYPLPY